MSMNNQEQNIKLVQEVGKRPVLYNYECPEYSIKSVTEQSWQEVAEIVDLPVSTVKDRWQNLKAVFRRTVRSFRDGTRKKPYYLDKAMEFYLPFVDSFTRVSAKSKNMQSEQQNITVTPQLTTEEIVESLGTYNNSFNKMFLIGNKTPRNVTSPDHQFVADYHTPEKESFQMKEAESSSERINMHQSAKMFLLSLMPELEELSDYQVKLFKRRVLLAIDEVSNCYE